MTKKGRRVRIVGKVNDIRSHQVEVTDLETGEKIDAAFRVLIEINIENPHNEAVIFVYEQDDTGPLKGGRYGYIRAHATEVDVTVLAEVVEIERGEDE